MEHEISRYPKLHHAEDAIAAQWGEWNKARGANHGIGFIELLGEVQVCRFWVYGIHPYF